MLQYASAFTGLIRLSLCTVTLFPSADVRYAEVRVENHTVSARDVQLIKLKSR
jgi:hypothetical protein